MRESNSLILNSDGKLGSLLVLHSLFEGEEGLPSLVKPCGPVFLSTQVIHETHVSVLRLVLLWIVVVTRQGSTMQKHLSRTSPHLFYRCAVQLHFFIGFSATKKNAFHAG